MIVVTVATGQLGRLVLEALLKQTPTGEIVAAVRNPDKAQDLAALGIEVRPADYSRPETLARAFASADKVLLISSSEVGQRVAQHKAVVDAARAAGVKLLAYTSILRADTSSLDLAREHKETEAYIRASGAPFALLRNGWYLETHTGALAPALQHGAILGAAREGHFASAARADYAEAAAAVLLNDGHEGKVYELAGDVPYTLAEFAAEVQKQALKPVAYRNLPQAEFEAALVGFGLPAPLARLLADADAGAAKGDLDEAGDDLSRLIGRPTTSLESAVHAALAA